MRIIAKQLIVEDVDGFKNDVFGRKPFGLALLNLITKTNEALVVSIDARWGEGKSTFVKMWRGMLSENGFPSIYFDAFQDDYSNDAFFSLASSITAYAQNNSDFASAEEFKRKAAKILVNLLSWSGRVGAKALTLGVIGKAEIDSLGDIKDDLAESAGGAAEKMLIDKLGDSQRDAALVESFKQTLSDLPSKIKSNEGNRLVIIIDELDRCKPTFAVDLLERMKHFFSVPNIVFVLVMNKDQLEGALKSVYGTDLDAKTYLQKFLTIEAFLPKRTSISGSVCDIDVYVKQLYLLHELELGEDSDIVIQFTSVLARTFNLSLRQLERVFTNIAIVYSVTKNGEYRLPVFVSFICIIKVIDAQLFQILLIGGFSYAQLIYHLDSKWPGWREAKGPDHGRIDWTCYTLQFVVCNEGEYQALDLGHSAKKMEANSYNFNLSRERIGPHFCEKLSMFSPQA